MKMHRVIIGALLALMPLAMLMAMPTVKLTVPPRGQWYIENLWKATIDNSGGDTGMVYFEGYAYNGGRQVFHATTKRFALQPGSKMYRYQDVQTEHTDVAPGYEAFVTRGGTFPSGSYSFKLLLMPFGVGDSFKFDVMPAGAPRLISPRKGDSVTSSPQFVWRPPSPLPKGRVTYELKLVQMMPNQTPEEAMRANRPWFSEDGITATSLTYPTSASPLDTALYAWQVEASVAGQRIARSDIWSFGYGRTPIGGGGQGGTKGPVCQMPIWPFYGTNCVDFNGSTPQATSYPGGLAQGSMATGWPGKCGKLLFYMLMDESEGLMNVYNRFGVNIGWLISNGSEVATVPVPNEPGRYYVFSTYSGALYCQIVDMNAANGAGEVDGSFWEELESYNVSGLAVSPPIGGTRYLYYTTSSNIKRMKIAAPATMNAASTTVIVPNTMGLGYRFLCTELEISHCGRFLAGTIRETSNPHTPAPDVVFVIGLNASGGWSGQKLWFQVGPAPNNPQNRYVVSGLEFTPTPTNGDPVLLFSAHPYPTPYSGQGGVYWTDLVAGSTPALIPGTEAYCESQLELAYPGSNYIFAANANSIAGIDISQPSAYQMDLGTQVSGLAVAHQQIGGFQTVYPHYILPDQIDGERYDWAAGTPADLWMSDGPNDDGTEPDTPTLTPFIWCSSDIWVAIPGRQQVGQTLPHSYPIYKNAHVNDEVNISMIDLDVFVKVRNRGCETSVQHVINGDQYPRLKLYYVEATGGQNSWPGPWQELTSAPVPVLDPGEEWTFRYTWAIQNFLQFITTDHFCLCARIVEDATAPFGMTYPEGADFGGNVWNNNNIVWHNVNVVLDKKKIKYRFVAQRYVGADSGFTLVFSSARRDGSDWKSPGVVVDLGRELGLRWVIGGQQGEGIVARDSFKFLLNAAKSTVKIPSVPAGVKYYIDVMLPEMGPDQLTISHLGKSQGRVPVADGGVTIQRFIRDLAREREARLKALQEKVRQTAQKLRGRRKQ